MRHRGCTSIGQSLYLWTLQEYQNHVDALIGSRIYDEDDAHVTIATPEGDLGGYVFIDTDTDGLVDGAEAGLAGVRVTLLDMISNSQIAFTYSDSDGYYKFSGVTSAADYVI